MRIKDILKTKGDDIYAVSPTTTLARAIHVLCEKRIGAVLVVDADKKVVGILSERDILRQCDEKADLETKPVGEVMTKDLVIGLPEYTLDQAMAAMTEKRIRHLPIMSGSEVEGMISIGDVVNAIRKERESEILYMKDYMAGNFHA